RGLHGLAVDDQLALPGNVCEHRPELGVLVKAPARPPERQPHRAGPHPLPDERPRPGKRTADVPLVVDLALELMPSHDAALHSLPPSPLLPSRAASARAPPARSTPRAPHVAVRCRGRAPRWRPAAGGGPWRRCTA